jgi:hypothetical protein
VLTVDDEECDALILGAACGERSGGTQYLAREAMPPCPAVGWDARRCIAVIEAVSWSGDDTQTRMQQKCSSVPTSPAAGRFSQPTESSVLCHTDEDVELKMPPYGSC